MSSSGNDGQNDYWNKQARQVIFLLFSWGVFKEKQTTFVSRLY